MSLLAPLRQSIDRLTELARNASSCSPRISDEIRSLYDDLALAEREIDFRLKSQADAIVRGAALVSKLEEASAELERANAVARAADQAKTEFLASVSHEIRTPLNGVVGMLEILALEKLTAHQREFVDTAQVSAETLLHLINDLLDFAKIEAGKADAKPAETKPQADAKPTLILATTRLSDGANAPAIAPANPTSSARRARGATSRRDSTVVGGPEKRVLFTAIPVS